MLSETHSPLDSQPDSRPAGRRLRVAFLAVFIIMASTARFTVAAFQSARSRVGIEGSVSDERGQPPPNARVRLESVEGEEIFETSVDEEGRYNFSALGRGVYNLVGTADGYETSRQTVDLTRSPVNTIVDIRMSPLKSARAAADPPSLTDAKAPRNARKEYERGLKALAADRVPEAKVHFAKAVKDYPCYARAQTAEALSLISDRDLKGAEAALQKAIDCDAGFAGAYLKLGELYNAEVRFEESRKVLEAGVRFEPASSKVHYSLGVAYYGLGSYDKAEEEYHRSESLTPPAPPEVHLKLADVYLKRAQYRQAYAEMQAYLTDDPQGRLAAKVRNLMAQMRATAHPAADGAATPKADPKP